jgi:probable rRNA maturation factor
MPQLMNIEINKLTTDNMDVGFLKKIAKRTAKLVKLKFSELSIAIVDDARMKALNKKHLNKNKTTDVLAFDYGEIVICLPQAKRQAKKFNLSTEQELATLLIHGILHLSGCDDTTKKEQEKMFKQQNKIFKEVL